MTTACRDDRICSRTTERSASSEMKKMSRMRAARLEKGTSLVPKPHSVDRMPGMGSSESRAADTSADLPTPSSPTTAAKTAFPVLSASR